MSFNINNFFNNDDVNIGATKGGFSVVEYKRDLSVVPETAIISYFSSVMKCRKRQLVIDMSKTRGVILQKGAMQWTVGTVNATTGIKGTGDFIGKVFKGKVSGESAIKPEYQGNGLLVCEPTHKHLILMDVADWGGSVVLDDGLFLACEASLKQSIVTRSNLSSAVASGEGFFNLGLSGTGVFCVESFCPESELIEVTLNDDEIKIDGNLAVAWSTDLKLTTERSGKTLLGSAASGEGLVNVFRGTGKVLLAPVSSGKMIDSVLA